MPKQDDRKLSRRQERDLDVEIDFLEALVRRAPDYVEALQVLGDDYSDRGRAGDGLKVDERLLQLRPDDANVRFNYASDLAALRKHASFKKVRAKIRALKAAVAKG